MSDAAACRHLADVQRACKTMETALRLQRPDRRFDDAAEAALAAPAADAATFTGALARFRVLAQVESGAVRGAAARRAEPDEATRLEAARQLAQRTPVRVTLSNGRPVMITSRSYAAAFHIASHHAAMQWAAKAAEEAGAAQDYEAHIRALMEAHLHRRAMWAHALTENGGPARSLEEAPAWVEELAPEDEPILLQGLYEAGPGRWARLGEAPRRKGPKGESEDFGIHSLLGMIAGREAVPMADLYDVDLYQLLVRERMRAPPVFGEEE